MAPEYGLLPERVAAAVAELLTGDLLAASRPGPIQDHHP
jgi:hypothetical protein